MIGFVTLKGKSQVHSDVHAFYFVKEQVLVHMLPLNINKKSYIAGPMALSKLTSHNQGHSDFEVLYLVYIS